MKQTNNALKFLLAQYRAIFKNAYVKGLASAAIVTAGLALAGTAQAAPVEIDGTNVNIPTDKATGASFDGEINRGEIFINKSGNYVNNLTINGGSLNSATLKDTPEELKGHLMVAGTITVNDGGTLNLSASGNGWGIMGWDGSTDDKTVDTNAHLGALVVNGGTVINTQSQIQLGSITFNGAKVTVGGNFNRTTQSAARWVDNAFINAEDSGSTGGEFTITGGSEVILNAGGSLMGHEVNVDNSTITFASGSTAMEYYAKGELSQNKNTAMIFAFADEADNDAAVLNLNNGAEVVVEEGGAGGLFMVSNVDSGASINFNSGSEVTVKNGGELVLGQRPFKTGSSTYKGDHVINFNDGSVLTNEGTLTFIKASSGPVTTNVNTGSHIINSGEESRTHIESGNTVIMNGGTLTNEGTLDIQQGGKLQIAETYSENAQTGEVINDGVVTLGGNINVDGQIRVSSGSTLELASGTNLGVSRNEATGDTGFIIVQGNIGDRINSTLKVDAATLKSFLQSGDTPIIGQGQDKAGSVFLNIATLDFGTAANLNDFSYYGASGSRAQAGKIVVRSDSTITADTLAINKALTIEDVNDSHKVEDRLHLDANTFKVFATASNLASINKANGILGFKDATVHSNLDVQYNGNTPLQVGNTYYLEAYTKNEADGTLSPADGTITGREFNLVSGGSLNVNAGNWTAAQAITVGSGATITVDTARDTNTKLTDSSLTLNGLVFDLSDASSNPTVTVKNTAGQKTGDTYYSSTLDLTAGVSVSKTGGSSASGSIITDGSGATILLNGSNVTDILADGSGTKNNLHYVGLAAYKGGVLDVNSAVSANYDDFVSGDGSTIASGDISFSGGGVFKAPSLTLTGKASTDGSTGTTLDIGSGVINVDTLTLNESGANTVTGDTKTVLQSGNLEVAQSFTAQSDILQVSGAHVYLDTGDAATTGSLAIKDLLITAGSFNVDQGTWNSYTSNVTVNGG
ncbi:MAG: hypothetical protein H9847_01900, partial [Candidatus Anaerobiospirillum pullicola]|nr:hypothetical protein [Candidatus Anaerobiospirillum pullicola]